MPESRPLTLAILLAASGAAGAQTLDRSQLRPVYVPVRDAGTFDWGTKEWIRGPLADRRARAAARADGGPVQTYTVFRNDCTWTGGGFFYAIESCEAVVEAGRIPAADTPPESLQGSPLGLMGATDDQVITSFQFQYCTFAVTGQVDLQIGFYDNLRGRCAGSVPVTPPPLSTQAVPRGNATAYFDFGSLAGYSLPGSSGGGMACWTVTIEIDGFCLSSEGDGEYDNDQSRDSFSWSFEHDLPTSVFGDTGPVLAGEPSTGGYGAGAYNIPAGSNSIFGSTPCGTGFGVDDGWWLNVTGSVPGVLNTVAGCGEAALSGSNCYWFGGWPGNPIGSFWMVLEAAGACGGCSSFPVAYCTAGTSASGCRALLTANGTASSSASTGLFLRAFGVEGATTGVFRYGTRGRQAVPFGNGTSYDCVVPPTRGTGVLAGGGTAGACDGRFELDLNTAWQLRPDAKPGAGATVQAQLWYLDPLNTSNQTSSSSNAVELTVCP